MSREPGPVGAHDLHAYLDGQLAPERHAEVEAFLANHPEEAQRLRDYQRINQGLHELFDGALAEPIPDAFLNHSKPRRWRPLLRVAAAAGWVLLGGILGWFGHDRSVERTPFTAALVQQAVVAHAVYSPEVRHPVEVDATQEQHLITWLSKRLGVTIRTPQLTALGYELLGGRLLPASPVPAAQFMYQNAKGQRLTLFVRKGAVANPDTAFRFVQQGSINAFYWIDEDIGYALVGTVDKPTLSTIAHVVYQQICLP